MSAISALTIIEDALRDIGVLRETESASAEMGETGLRKLNQMLAAFQKSGPKLDGYAATLAGELQLDDGDQLGVTARLGILLAPIYGRTVSQEMVANAKEFVDRLDAQAALANIRELSFSHVPGGGGLWDINTDTVQ